MFLNIQVPIVDLGKILSQSRLNTTYSNHQLQNHAHVHTQGIQQQQKKIYLKFREEKQIEKNVIKRERERERVRTHEGFGSESGAGSDEPAEVSGPRHRRSRRDLPLRGLVALAITGPAVHG